MCASMYVCAHSQLKTEQELANQEDVAIISHL